MKRYAMALNGLFMISSAVFLVGPNLWEFHIIILFSIILLWIGLELFIVFVKPYKGVAPSNPIINIIRFVWLLSVIYSWLDLRNNWTRIDLNSWVLVLLLLLSFGGLLIRTWAVIHLGESFSYDVKRPQGQVLVKTGPYRLVRHPSYLGMGILLSLPGLITGSIPAFVGMLLTMVIQIIFRIRAEEKMLEVEFKDVFLEYKKITHRLIPFIY